MKHAVDHYVCIILHVLMNTRKRQNLAERITFGLLLALAGGASVLLASTFAFRWHGQLARRAALVAWSRYCLHSYRHFRPFIRTCFEDSSQGG